jgi:hypothetical protein
VFISSNANDAFNHASSLTIEVPVAGTESIVAALDPGLEEPTTLAEELPGRILSSGPRSIFRTLPLQVS